MLDMLKRSTVHLLKKRGYRKKEIARTVGCHRNTVSKVLKEKPDKTYKRKRVPSQVDIYWNRIVDWLDKNIPVTRMLEMAREDKDNPYQGGKSAFYDRVRLIRSEVRKDKNIAIWRFEGLPGEYLQVDWGKIPTKYLKGKGKKYKYIFVARLKYSRFVFVRFTYTMDQETIIRCLLSCFEIIGGIPWVVVFDNIKTVTIGRDSQGNPVWNQAFLKFALEVGFHPDVCWPRAANQKGTVESGVKYVKTNFFPGREFSDDKDIAGQAEKWMGRVNTKVNQATGKPPIEMLEEEVPHLSPLLEDAEEYGIMFLSKVTPSSVIHFETNFYSVPERYINCYVQVRVRRKRIDIYHQDTQIASHERSFEKRRWIRDLSHYQRAFKKKPRALSMAKREKLLEKDDVISSYVREISRRYPDNWQKDVDTLYYLLGLYGEHKLKEAILKTAKYELFGSCYVRAFLENSLELVPLNGKTPDPVLTRYESYVRGASL